jgi:hypothetical protein
MAQVYPSVRNTADALEYLDFWYRAMTLFFTTAADARDRPNRLSHVDSLITTVLLPGSAGCGATLHLVCP